MDSLPIFSDIKAQDRIHRLKQYLSSVNERVWKYGGFKPFEFNADTPHVGFRLNFSEHRPFYIFNADGEHCSVRCGSEYKEYAVWDDALEHFELEIRETMANLENIFPEEI